MDLTETYRFSGPGMMSQSTDLVKKMSTGQKKKIQLTVHRSSYNMTTEHKSSYHSQMSHKSTSSKPSNKQFHTNDLQVGVCTQLHDYQQNVTVDAEIVLLDVPVCCWYSKYFVVFGSSMKCVVQCPLAPLPPCVHCTVSLGQKVTGSCSLLSRGGREGGTACLPACLPDD
eukprot:TRINITY_DN1894_c0_g3_i3.p1 TRINITY_DN1894_c0_g3~~TRINITY_DN1894_c0_g3_i3.p1  ORF type:complete len:170 (-),score=23.97 TRINITY_DN1894_c0_g3_i3:51-560(-)